MREYENNQTGQSAYPLHCCAGKPDMVIFLTGAMS